MAFLQVVQEWLLNQDDDTVVSLIDYGDGVTLKQAQDEIIGGANIVEVYEITPGEFVLVFVLSNGTRLYTEGTFNDVNNEIFA